MEWLLVLVFVFFVIFFLAKTGKGDSLFKYRKKGAVFSPAERSFLGVLDQAVASDYRVLGKVRVADILSPEKGLSRKNWQVAFNKISAKHFDFVLCDKSSLDVVAVIELDDKSHKRKKSQARDAVIETVCESAGLTLIRFSAKAGYQIDSVRKQVELALDSPADCELALNDAN